MKQRRARILLRRAAAPPPRGLRFQPVRRVGGPVLDLAGADDDGHPFRISVHGGSVAARAAECKCARQGRQPGQGECNLPDIVTELDRFSVNRARQMCAMLDRPASLREGDALPRGWHNAMFAPAASPSRLRPDGFAGPGVTLPETDLPRLMFGGRRIGFHGDIAIGAPARQVSRLRSAVEKQGRTGRLMIVTVLRETFCGGSDPVIVDEQDYVLREAATPGAAEPPPGEPTPGGRLFQADPQLLFRYCALTFNTHRIHYDHPYATAVEGYPALVVNGGLTTLMLTELFRERAGREPDFVTATNRHPAVLRPRQHAACPPGRPWLGAVGGGRCRPPRARCDHRLIDGER